MNISHSVDSNHINDILNGNITLEEVNMAIKAAKNGKAVGIDNIPNEILKCKTINIVLQKLFVKPGKDPRIPTNCRGISLISTVSKVFSSILNTRLTKIVDSNNVLCEEQNGFRKMRSCIEHIYTLSTIIKMKRKINKSVFVCFIDFSKAFDSVNRDLLWFCLLNYGIDGKFLQILKAMYKNVELCIKLHDHLTNWFGSSVGVRQGDALSPMLFNLFMNNLASEVKSLNCGVKLGDTTISTRGSLAKKKDNVFA